MAKKKTTKKKVTKKKTVAASKAGKGGSSSSSSQVKKTTKKKTTAKKTSSKKITKKKPASPAKKKTTKKKVTKTTKKVAKKVAKKSSKKKTTAKKVAKQTTKKASTTKKKVVKKSAKKTSAAKPAAQPAAKAAASKSGSKAASKPASDPKGDAKANAKPSDNRRRRSSKSKKPALVMPTRPLLLGPNGPALKPLIPSGARVQQKQSVLDNVTSRRKKTPLTKTQLEHYRQILLNKRAELLGDMRHLEDEALRSDSGRSSANSQHLAEQGSDSYEQTLNLNLAASDRDRINEIDAALARIADRTYGLCELTFEPIKRARLDEIPWARYTIEAARELDRRGGKR